MFQSDSFEIRKARTVPAAEGQAEPTKVGQDNMAMTEERVSEYATKQCYCEGRMVRSALSTNLSVRHVGESSADYWSTSKLDAFTCTACGRTELFAENPGAIS